MRLVAGERTLAHVAANGGAVYLWPRSSRCCGGRMHVLEAALQPPDRVFEVVHAEAGIAVHATPGLARPDEIQLELSRQGRLEAFWNGQSWIG
jgi:xanthine/CO dehydrogenase XdhC/CoxF family maturation factor